MIRERVLEASGTQDIMSVTVSDSNGMVGVTGHSLGGHLAVALEAELNGIKNSSSTFAPFGLNARPANGDYFKVFDGTE